MKLFFATLLSLIIFLPSLGSVVIYAQFKMAQDQISKTICVQRDNINNSCNGRCELLKSLKKYDENEKRMNNSNLNEKAALVYTANTVDYQVHTSYISQRKPKVFVSFTKKTKAIVFALFRPPLV
ncbi:hypothetical protein [Flavobacterium algicola]|uniref:hypothetical protein n=1 Tax=Flavobacterium algicola TaxID=556529 RepID=UPI001EFE6759|nr:hypothetical protein [Flavobacterium algicola]MCG9793308.1 hypothetical protein [Flavobacterium algicola]